MKIAAITLTIFLSSVLNASAIFSSQNVLLEETETSLTLINSDNQNSTVVTLLPLEEVQDESGLLTYFPYKYDAALDYSVFSLLQIFDQDGQGLIGKKITLLPGERKRLTLTPGSSWPSCEGSFLGGLQAFVEGHPEYLMITNLTYHCDAHPLALRFNRFTIEKEQIILSIQNSSPTSFAVTLRLTTMGVNNEEIELLTVKLANPLLPQTSVTRKFSLKNLKEKIGNRHLLIATLIYGNEFDTPLKKTKVLSIQ